ncbi:MAG: FAD-dependent oxidoreductase [Saprospiraceae bacterium]
MEQNDLEELDFLIVGQGLAGTMMAHFLLQENKRIKILDLPMRGRTSTIAAGVINPVTGRRIAKSWHFEVLYAFAKKTYQELENILGITLWHDRNILRALHNTFEENEWYRRGAFPEYEAYFEDSADLENISSKIKPAHAWGEMRHCAQVALPELVRSYRRWLQRQGLFLEEKFDYQAIVFQDGRVQYKQFSALKIIFCEGARAIANPYFNFLPFVPTKGELLILKIPGADFEKIVKHHLFIVPVEQWNGATIPHLFWAGSTSRFEYADELPSEEQKRNLLDKLEKTLSVPFEVFEHLAGIRPTVFDKRPFSGVHPSHGQLAIFNGLGTKGASLAPFFAKQMADFLLGNGELDKEVDIKRFLKNDG